MGRSRGLLFSSLIKPVDAFGPSAFLWITFGTIFIGAVHDFFSGFLSLRNDGYTMPNIISKYLGKKVQKFINFFRPEYQSTRFGVSFAVF